MRHTSLIIVATLIASWSTGFEVAAPASAQQIIPLDGSRQLYGAMEAGERQFRFLIEVKPDGTAELKSLDENNILSPLDDFECDAAHLKFRIKATQAEYAGTKTGDTYTGTWSQNRTQVELNFTESKSVPEDQPSEIWVGELNAGPQKLQVQFRGYQQADGTTRYFFDSLTQKAGGFIGRGTRDGNRLQLEFPALGAKYTGEIDADGQQIKGKFTQGVDFNLDLTRSETLQNGKPNHRPQTPQPPFPYEAREVKFPSEGGAIELAGTLTFPSGGGTFPLAIMISGSGPQDRDETIFEHKPFLVIADHLTRHGIAVLRYDDRGVGQSQGDFAASTSRDFANDAASAVKYAKTLPEIDSSKIGLIGHSEGGIVGPMVAAEDPEVAFVVMLAGPSVNGEKILFSQVRLIGQGNGMTEDKLQILGKAQELTFETIRQMKPDEKLVDTLSDKTQAIFDELKSQFPEVADDEKNSQTWIVSNLTEMNRPWFRFFAVHEPAPVLEKVTCPVLALNGERDLQVDPKLNLPGIEAALKKGGNSDFQVVELPGMNHLFQSCDTGAISRYVEIEETIAPAVLELMTEWIGQRMSK